MLARPMMASVRNEDFSERSPGRLVAIQKNARAFVPAIIPRALTLGAEVVRLVGSARGALGELEAGVLRLPSADLVIEPFQMNEAVLSSRIEGTYTTLTEALADAATGDVKNARFSDADARAVANYSRALRLGLDELSGGRGITLGLLRNLQTELLRGDPKAGRIAGKFRDRQVGIGPPECEHDINLARFVPPPAGEVDLLLRDWEAYVGELSSDEPLVRIALTHYQFEAIHPFADGNGRVGRILLPLQMVREGVMTRPWLYLSPEIERRRKDYVEALYKVSTVGAFHDWLRFFLEVVLVSAQSTLRKLAEIHELEEKIETQLVGYKSQLPLRLLPYLFGRAVISIPGAARHLACTPAAARKTVLELERRGIVRKLDFTMRYKTLGRPSTVYICDELVDIITRQPPAESGPASSVARVVT
jgi:Fic family protein